MRNSDRWFIRVMVLCWILILALIFFRPTPCKAYDAEFETRAITFVEKYNPEFIPWAGYLMFVAHQYDLTDWDIAVLLGQAKMETLFGKTGSGKYHNVAGIKPKGFARYSNWFEGIDAYVSLYVRKYKGLTLAQIHRKWVGKYNPRYYRDLQRTIRILSPQ